MDPREDPELVEKRLTRVIAAELDWQIRMQRPLSAIPALIADEILTGFEVRLRDPASGSHGPEPTLPDSPVRTD